MAGHGSCLVAVHAALIRGGLAAVVAASTLGGLPATAAADPDPATAPIVRFVGRTVPHGASGYAELTRVLGKGVMVFWVTNQVRGAGRWNLERDGTRLTAGVVRRLIGPVEGDSP